MVKKFSIFVNESIKSQEKYEIKYEKWKWGGYSEGYDSWYLYKNGIPIVGISNDNKDKNNVLIRHIESKEKGMGTKFILMLLNNGVSIQTGKPDYNSISTSAYYMIKKINNLINNNGNIGVKILGKADNRGKKEEEKYKDMIKKEDNYHYKWFKK